MRISQVTIARKSTYLKLLDDLTRKKITKWEQKKKKKKKVKQKRKKE